MRLVMPRWLPVALLVLVPVGCSASRLGPQEVGSVKAAVASAGTLLLALRVLLARRPALLARLGRPWDGALLLLGLLAAACWWNLFRFNYPAFGHPSETYHYYIGSKYFPELGYTRLYQCTAVADAEAGHRAAVEARSLRNLETNELQPAARALAEAEACKRHFSPERWRSFSRDVAWFRMRLPERRWHRTQIDHGYNGTPAWGFFGRVLASTGRASDGQILALRLIDPLLLVVTWAFVGSTFGWRTLCVALLYWGTNYPAQYSWVGGSYLRQIEVAALLAGICLLRRRREVAGGFLVMLGALTRIYPGLLLAGPALAAVARGIAGRRPSVTASQRRLAAGALLGLAVLLPLSFAGTGSVRAWFDFAHNSRVLLDTPLRNNLGLRTLLSYDPDARARDVRDPTLADALDPWKRARKEAFAARMPLFVAVLGAYVVLLAAAARRQPDWVAVVLGAGLAPLATDLTCYYSVVLVAFALLWERHPSVGVALCGLSAVGWALVDRFHFFDEIFTWQSLATAVFVVFATVRVWRRPPGGVG